MHNLILTILNATLGINFILSEVLQDVINAINEDKVKKD